MISNKFSQINVNLNFSQLVLSSWFWSVSRSTRDSSSTKCLVLNRCWRMESFPTLSTSSSPGPSLCWQSLDSSSPSPNQSSRSTGFLQNNLSNQWVGFVENTFIRLEVKNEIYFSTGLHSGRSKDFIILHLAVCTTNNDFLQYKIIPKLHPQEVQKQNNWTQSEQDYHQKANFEGSHL